MPGYDLLNKSQPIKWWLTSTILFLPFSLRMAVCKLMKKTFLNTKKFARKHACAYVNKLSAIQREFPWYSLFTLCFDISPHSPRLHVIVQTFHWLVLVASVITLCRLRASNTLETRQTKRTTEADRDHKRRLANDPRIEIAIHKSLVV